MPKLITVSENLLKDLLPHVKNTSLETRLGMAQVVIYQKKKSFIYQDKLLKAQNEAKQKKLGIWGK